MAATNGAFVRGAGVEAVLQPPESGAAAYAGSAATLAGDRDLFPPTAWTRIVQAQNPASAAYQPSLAALAALYDRPLLCLFRQRLYDPWRRECEDWKQDFIVSHLLSGKVVSQVRPASRFRSYLAVAVRNYIRDRLASVKARREVPLEVDPQMSERADEALLSRERALDCVELATRRLQEWARQSGDSERLRLADALAERPDDLRPMGRAGTVDREVIDRFKQLLRLAVREEMLVAAGQDEQSVLDREAAILIDALAQPSRHAT